MKRRVFSIIAICLVLSILPAAARAGVIYVDGGVSSSGTGDSWGEAHKTITEALAAAASGDEIWVKQGTYTESITLISGVALYGGFDGNESILSDRDWEVNITTIDASTADSGAPADHVVIMDGITNARIDGFTITGGDADGSSPDYYGGGIYCYKSSMIISRCTISGNSADNGGGGIYCYSSSPSISRCTISRCTISGNSAGYDGGGIYCEYKSSPNISHCTISGNSAGNGGGGILCYSSSTIISHCTISGNSAGYSGGGICGFAPSTIISHCTISGNSADIGGGIHCLESSPIISNCTISGNSADYYASGIYCWFSSPIISNCTISGNSADIGGGIHCLESSPIISNCTISGNSAGYYAGGIYCWFSSPIISNCTISGNSAGYGGGIYCTHKSSPIITNSILTKNSQNAIYEYSADSDPEVTFCLFHGNPDGDYYDEHSSSYTGAASINESVAGAGDNIDGDPLFVDGPSGTWSSSPVHDSGTNQTTLTDDSKAYQTDELAGWLINPDTSQNREALIVSNTATTIVVVGNVTSFASDGDAYKIMDYHIQPGSAAKDMGTSSGAPVFDFEGDSRPYDSGYDIGVDEYDDSTPTVSSVQVQSGLEVDVTFSKGMDQSALTPGNYTVSGSGQGTLPANPADVTYQEASTYRLTWDSSQAYEMVNGGDITITVANVQDHFGTPIGSLDWGTHTGGAIGTLPTAEAITPLTSSPTNAATVSFTVEFSEDVTGFDDVTDLVVNKDTGVTFSGASFSGGPAEYTVNILDVAGDGEISLAADVSSNVTDDVGNPLESSVTSAVVTIDNTVAAPTIIGISTDTGASGDGVTSDKTLELSGTAEAGSTVEVFRDSTSLGDTTADGAGDWTFDYTGTALADGDYIFTARSTDLVGNVSSESSGFDVTVDTTVHAPTNLDLAAADDSGSSNNDNLTKNTSNLTISGFGEEGSTVRLYNGGTAISGATATVSGGSFSLDVTLSANQTHTLTARQTDPAGNVSASSSGLNITVDTTAQAPANLDLAAADDSGSSNSDNITKNTSNLTISGSGEEGSTVKLYNGGTAISGATGTVSGGTFSIDVSLSANKTHALTAIQTDPAGNESTVSSSLNITVDTTALAPTSLDLAAEDDSGSSNSDNITQNTSNLTISGSGEEGSTVKLYNGGTAISGATGTVSGGTFSIDVSLSANKTHALTAIQTDPAGNESTVSSGLNITVDTTVQAPTNLDLAAADDSGSSNSDNITQNTSGLTISGSGEEGSTVKLYNGGTAISGATSTVSGGSFSLDIALAANQTHTLTAIQTDPAGNESAASSALDITIVTTVLAPTNLDLADVDDSGSSDSDNITQNTSNLTITGSGEEGATVQLYDDGTAISGATSTVSGGTFSIDIALSADQIHPLTAIQTNPAGNESAASSALNITVDTTAQAPTNLDLAATDDSGTSNGDNITKNTSNLTISGLGEEGSTVRLYDDGSVISGAAAAVTGGTFSIDVSLTANQTHPLTASQTDPAGNTSSASANLDITVDTAVPSISITEPANGSSGESLDAVIGFSSDSLAGVSIVELRIADGSQYIDQDQAHVSTPTWVTASGTDSWSFTTSLVNWKNDAAYTITARATDRAGNTRQSESHSWTNTTRDTVEQPVFSPPPGKYRHRQQVTATCDTAGATIYCTTDGSEPTETAPACGEEPVTIDQTTILKAKAFKSGWTPSAATEGLYEIIKGLPWILPLLE